MKKMKAVFFTMLAVAALSVFLIQSGVSAQQPADQAKKQQQPKQAAAKPLVQAPDTVTPAPKMAFFPCSQCHAAMPANKTERALAFHTEIALKHMPAGWCFNCHDEKNRDKLKLANGDLIDYNDSAKLCGQCHGATLKEWQDGVHGKRTGMWNGKKVYENCLTCHDQHQPAFKAIKPLPAPEKPEKIIYKNKK
ncbi:MAG: hypothetical protein LLF86_03230 [Nitrospiraceae bacterium]|nr:hypothetical protein [Nitrospiraceae bacterium]